MGPLDITSTVRHIGILTRLIDGFEYMKLGLCGLNYGLALRDGEKYYYPTIERDGEKYYYPTIEFLSFAMPEPRYSLIYGNNNFSWPAGDHDRRFYWLKSQLEKYKNQLKEYGNN